MIANVKKNIAENINNRYPMHNIFYLYNNITEQSKRDKILYILNNETDLDVIKNKIKNVLDLKNHTNKVTSVAFKWLVDENNNSFYVIFGFSTFYNSTGKEQINKNKIRTTSINRLYSKPFVQQIFVNKDRKITYKIVYEWIKKNYKKYRY